MKGGSQTQTTRIDPASQTYVDEMRRRSLGLQDRSMVGWDALAGDPLAVQRMMNPYEGTLDPYWNQLRGQTLSSIGAQATGQNAYGGSRHAIAEGMGLAGIADAQAMQRYNEYARAMGQAGQLAGLGMGAMQSGLGPTGQISRVPTQSSPLMGLLGTGIGLAGAFPGLFPALGIPGLAGPGYQG